MTDRDRPSTPDDGRPDDGLAAAELALGVLEGEERAAALRRLAAEPDFAREVERWQAHFAPLYETIPEVMPSDAVWNRIAARIGPADDNVVPIRRLRIWQTLAGASSAAAAILLALLVTRPAPPEPQPPAPARPPMVASLGAPDATSLLASWDPGSTMLRVRPLALTPGNRSAELWVIPEGGEPHSLGLVDPAGTTHVPLTSSLRAMMKDNSTLAVTLEPKGGSPTGKPTGAIIASGHLSTI